MKRYMLFVNATHYPEGGGHDFEGAYETIEDCVRIFETELSDNNRNDIECNIFDIEQEKVVRHFCSYGFGAQWHQGKLKD